MKKFMALVMAVVMVFSLAACGGNDGTVSVDVAEDATTSGSDTAETVAVGNKITTDFVELTITEAAVQSSAKTSIKTGNFTRTFGPDDSAETEFAVIKGKITNKSTSTIGNGIVSNVVAGEYTLEEDDVYIYKSDGDTVWELSPLVEYNFMLIVEVPNALVGTADGLNFNFGFNEGLDNMVVDFSELDYKYSLKIAPTATAE